MVLIMLSGKNEVVVRAHGTATHLHAKADLRLETRLHSSPISDFSLSHLPGQLSKIPWSRITGPSTVRVHTMKEEAFNQPRQLKVAEQASASR